MIELPPGAAIFSTIKTLAPASLASMAALNPAYPDPTTNTSVFLFPSIILFYSINSLIAFKSA
jgi:hypothetical protein